MMDISSVLIVERGSPYEEGIAFPLQSSKVIIGRKGKQWIPDISFSNVFVSRKHIAIYYETGNFFVQDLNSKHGTFINNKRLPANSSTILKHTDRISLANDLIVLSFLTHNSDETVDLTPIFTKINNHSSKDVKLDPLKQELVIQHKLYVFSEKEYKCVEFLIKNMEQFVSKEELKECVWPERSHSLGITPDVSPEEMNALIYRIRKKTQQSICIESIRGKGYILSIN